MSDEVKRICEEWAKHGLANECFWEGWPECSTPQDSLTPAMVLDRIEALEAQLAQANAALKAADALETAAFYVCQAWEDLGHYQIPMVSLERHRVEDLETFLREYNKKRGAGAD